MSRSTVNLGSGSWSNATVWKLNFLQNGQRTIVIGEWGNWDTTLLRLRFMLNAWLCVHYKFSYYIIIITIICGTQGWCSHRASAECVSWVCTTQTSSRSWCCFTGDSDCSLWSLASSSVSESDPSLHSTLLCAPTLWLTVLRNYSRVHCATVLSAHACFDAFVINC